MRFFSLLVFSALKSAHVFAGEATISTDGEVDDISNATDNCVDLLSGKVSTCHTYQIATLNASPRRCIHIETPPPQKEQEVPDICIDFPNYFDGTNGCLAYAQNDHFCNEYGDNVYDASPYKPNQACCACGGGNKSKPRLRVGDNVVLKGEMSMMSCKDLSILRIETDPIFQYVVRVNKGCGMAQRYFNGETLVENYQYPEGANILVKTDDPGNIEKYYKVELKKCRRGAKAQEFMFQQGSADASKIIILHKETQSPLVTTMGAVSPFVNVTQVWEDGLFDGSGDYFYMQMITSTNEGQFTNGKPMKPATSWLLSGYFGEQEYSEVRPRANTGSGDASDQEHSMWTFKQVLDDEANETSDVVDEHVEWLEKKTEMIGIDYLEEMPPWDLLDVDRSAGKKEVKSRFRELSRSFHPDKMMHHPEKKDLFEKIFVLLQNAYQGLKSGSEGDKEKFRREGDTGSQLFTHSQFVVELLPNYWTKIEQDDNTAQATDGVKRYILNVASHLNSTLVDSTVAEEESEATVQLWVVFMYSPKCGMSRTTRGMVDIAAAHLEKNFNIKVGAYACGLYKGFEASPTDPIGVSSDPICAQFERMETPNVHVIVETLPGRKFDENGVLVDQPLDPDLVIQNAKFKHFYAAVPHGTTTEFHPEAFIKFARQGKRVWDYSHLVTRMLRSSFNDADFINNSSLVAFFDGTGNGETNAEVVDAIKGALPGVAHRFLNDGLYVGTASCGFGDEVDERLIDCSQYSVSWLPDIKIYGQNDTVGTSLLRGQFGDRRDVQISLESMGNVLRMMLGGEDNNEDEYEEMKEPEDTGEGGSCQQSSPPPEYQPDMDFEKLEEPDEVPLLDEPEEADENPELDKEEEKSKVDEGPRKPKLAGGESIAELDGGPRENKRIQDRVAGFDNRANKRRGGGALMGGGGGGGGGFIAR
ncbi:hypothetical protein ACHAWO_009451 [Cyclotella atomus]|uniref:J domain-containing protein n=1 Tax=Cyclotella atomus TaxID=382360 RepID=A0ABD3PW41_9STRA